MPPTPDRCLVTGGSGAVGPALTRALVDRGLAVRVLARRAPPPGTLPDGVEVALGDIADRAAVQRASTDARWVFHLAALLHQRPDPRLDEEFARVNVEGTRVVLDAALRAGVERVVFFSTIAVYGASRGIVLTEDAEVRPATAYARTKYQAEQLVRAATRAGGQPMGTILRLAAVYGPHVRGNYRRLATALAGRRFVPIGDGRNRRTVVFDADVARASLLAATHPRAAGRVYNVTDGTPHPLREIVQAMCGALGRRPPFVSLPVAPVRGVATVVDRAAAAMGKPDVRMAAALETYLDDVAVDGGRICDELGFAAQYDLRAGWDLTARSLRLGRRR